MSAVLYIHLLAWLQGWPDQERLSGYNHHYNRLKNVIDPPPERILWCYSQGIPENLEQDSYFDVNIRNLVVIDDQMVKARSDITSSKPECHLYFAKPIPSRQRQPKHQLKQSLLGPFQESLRQTTDFDASKTNVHKTNWLVVDLKPTTRDSCRLRTNVLPGEEKFDKGGVEASISQELLQYLKQQPDDCPSNSEDATLAEYADNVLYRTDLEEYDKARQYIQLQNRFLMYKWQLDSIPEATNDLPSHLVTSHLVQHRAYFSSPITTKAILKMSFYWYYPTIPSDKFKLNLLLKQAQKDYVTANHLHLGVGV